jgi:hypothetical protein
MKFNTKFTLSMEDMVILQKYTSDKVDERDRLYLSHFHLDHSGHMPFSITNNSAFKRVVQAEDDRWYGLHWETKGALFDWVIDNSYDNLEAALGWISNSYWYAVGPERRKYKPITRVEKPITIHSLLTNIIEYYLSFEPYWQSKADTAYFYVNYLRFLPPNMDARYLALAWKIYMDRLPDQSNKLSIYSLFSMRDRLDLCAKFGVIPASDDAFNRAYALTLMNILVKNADERLRGMHPDALIPIRDAIISS